VLLKIQFLGVQPGDPLVSGLNGFLSIDVPCLKFQERAKKIPVQ
jgi:hypothetical protein